MRYESFHDRLTSAITSGPAQTPESLRQAILKRARQAATEDALPPALARYVDTVARHAYKVTDADVAGLQQAGHSDDEMFEITVAAAVGAAMHRLARGMAALRGEASE